MNTGGGVRSSVQYTLQGEAAGRSHGHLLEPKVSGPETASRGIIQYASTDAQSLKATTRRWRPSSTVGSAVTSLLSGRVKNRGCLAEVLTETLHCAQRFSRVRVPLIRWARQRSAARQMREGGDLRGGSRRSYSELDRIEKPYPRSSRVGNTRRSESMSSTANMISVSFEARIHFIQDSPDRRQPGRSAHRRTKHLAYPRHQESFFR